jgi:uncharacterized protein YabE (DUF348 family)
VLVAVLGFGYILTGRPVMVNINGQAYPIRTHRPTVDAVIQSLGLTLQPQDRLYPPPGGQLGPGQTLTINLARPLFIEADGHTRSWLTHQSTIAGVLTEAGLTLNPRDKILVNGVEARHNAPLPLVQPALPAFTGLANLLAFSRTPLGAVSARPEPVQLTVRRAIPLTLVDDRVSSAFFTTQSTIGQALQEQGVTVYQGDQVTPGLDTPLAPGMRVYIKRATPITINADGRQVNLRTLHPTVGPALTEAGVALMGQDFSQPAADTPLKANMQIKVVRVHEAFEIEQEFIPFETNWIPDESMELDQREERQPGITGVIKTRTRIRYEDGQEVERRLEDKWLDQAPSDRVVAYGANVMVRTLQTPDGPIEYWRKISMLLTPYTAASSGKSRDDPLYGITRTGVRVSYGMAAVDPKVISLGTQLYVPGYGRAVAADTGGLIVGKHIDLAFDEGQPIPDLYNWGDVYILTPVPPANRIRYVLPQWPQRE